MMNNLKYTQIAKHLKHKPMKLMTTELTKRFKEVGDQSELESPIVIAKFFDPCGAATWYAIEYNPETNICFGYVTGLAFDEWGTFSISELESIKRPFGISIERDIHFKEISFKELLNKNRISELKKDKSKNKNQELEH